MQTRNSDRCTIFVDCCAYSMIPSVSKHVAAWRFQAKTFLSTRPSLYFPLYRRKQNHSGLLVTRETDLCVDGYPRSANSFATSAIQAAQQPEPISIAHHTHVAANLMQACEWGVPAVMLIRAPKDAIVSFTALRQEVMSREQGQNEPIPFLPFAIQVDAWIAFYQSLLPYRDQLVIAPFPAVVSDMGAVINAINGKYETDFTRFEHTEDNVAAVHARRGYHAGPSEHRAQIKRDTKEVFQTEVREHPDLQERLEYAVALYEKWERLSMLPARS